VRPSYRRWFFGGHAELFSDVVREASSSMCGFLPRRTVEHRRRERHAFAQVVRQFEDLVVGEAFQVFRRPDSL
jgi:hypothetical protein